MTISHTPFCLPKSLATPLHLATISDDASFVTLLLEHGADRSATNREGQTALAMCLDDDVEAALVRSDILLLFCDAAFLSLLHIILFRKLRL